MNNKRTLLVIGFLIAATQMTYCQNNVGRLRLDPNFGNGGSVQLDAGNTIDEVIASSTFHYKTPDNSNYFADIILLGKVKTLGSPWVRLAMARLTADGRRDSSFGFNGISQQTWDKYNNPYCLVVPDSETIFCAGSSAGATSSIDLEPSIYKFHSDGTTYEDFGISGRKVFRYEDGSGGEILNLDTAKGKYIAAGYSTPGPFGGTSGFAAIRFKADGSLDSSFGINGKAIIAAPIRRGIGYVRKNNQEIYFIGADTASKSELVLALMTADGQPNQSFGQAGIVYTGVKLQEGAEFYSSLQQPASLIAGGQVDGSSPGTSFTLVKFLSDGSRDMQFGSDGYTEAPHSLSNMQLKGLSVSNDGSDLACGSYNIGNNKVSAAAKFFPNGTLDQKFGDGGLAIIDIGKGNADNWIINFNAIGRDINDNNRRKYLGIGTTFSEVTNRDFFVARYDTVEKNIVFPASKLRSSISPNPAYKILNVSAPKLGDKSSFTIIDILGRTVLSSMFFSQNVQVDISHLKTGNYLVAIQMDGKQYTQSFLKLSD